MRSEHDEPVGLDAPAALEDPSFIADLRLLKRIWANTPRNHSSSCAYNSATPAAFRPATPDGTSPSRRRAHHEQVIDTCSPANSTWSLAALSVLDAATSLQVRIRTSSTAPARSLG